MSTSGEAADQMAREALQFSEVAIKLTALGFKNSLALALAYAKENPKVRGKTSLDRLLRENKELKVIPIKTKMYPNSKSTPSNTAYSLLLSRINLPKGKRLILCSRRRMSASSTASMSRWVTTFRKRRDRPTEKKASARNPQGPELRVPEKGSMTYDKRPSVRMKIDHYRAVAKAISETQKALQKGIKEAVTKEAR